MLCLFGVAFSKIFADAMDDPKRLREVLKRRDEDWLPRVDEEVYSRTTPMLTSANRRRWAAISQYLDAHGPSLTEDEAHRHLLYVVGQIESISAQPEPLSPNLGERNRRIPAVMTTWLLATCLDLPMESDLLTTVQDFDFENLTGLLNQCAPFQTRMHPVTEDEVETATYSLLLILYPEEDGSEEGDVEAGGGPEGVDAARPEEEEEDGDEDDSGEPEEDEFPTVKKRTCDEAFGLVIWDE
jgi:hypothetical protein